MTARKLIFAFVIVLLAAAAFVGVGAWKAYAQGSSDDSLPCRRSSSAHSWGMMGGHYGYDDTECADDRYGRQPVMGSGGMMGGYHQGGMMNGWYNQQDWDYDHHEMMESWTPPAELAPTGATLTLDEASAIAEAYLAAQSNSAMVLGDVADYGRYFYADAVGADNELPMFGFMIDATTGTVYFGYGCIQ